MIPHRTPIFLPLLYPSLTWRMPSEENVIYLTFDDGPVPGATEFVLDELARFDIPATFFCIGDNVQKHPAIFQRIMKDGHAIGNHTVNHLNGWKTNNAGYVKNVRLFDAIAQQAGLPHETRLFRPPYGCITHRQVSALHDYRIIMWDVLSQDYDQTLSPEKCFRGTARVCRKGSIVVLHDSYKAQKNMEYTLPRLIETLGSQGFEFRAL